MTAVQLPETFCYFTQNLASSTPVELTQLPVHVSQFLTPSLFIYRGGVVRTRLLKGQGLPESRKLLTDWLLSLEISLVYRCH